MRKNVFKRDFNAFKASLLVIALAAAWMLGDMPTAQTDHGAAQLYKASVNVLPINPCCNGPVDL